MFLIGPYFASIPEIFVDLFAVELDVCDELFALWSIKSVSLEFPVSMEIIKLLQLPVRLQIPLS